MTPLVLARGPALHERPIYQWESGAKGAAATLRLFGTLGRRELTLALEAIMERARSPRDVICIDFEHVEHLDFRAAPEFAHRLARQRDRGSSIWLTGMTPYVRSLFDVAGQGAVVGQFTWNAEAEAFGVERIRPLAGRVLTGSRPARGGAWH
jgi:ABC-type transporter Mla MlaB component